jgi:mono/diheme cytochrome c family protein
VGSVEPPAETGGTETGGTETGATDGGGGGTAQGDPAAGKEVFAAAGCASCHTLADAGAAGAIGPNLDEAKPAAELVVDRVTNGMGVMPAFSGQLSEEQIQDVAAYVVQATSG